MFSKIQQKQLGIYYIVDECQQSESVLTIRGWMCSTKYRFKNVHFLIEDKTKSSFLIKGKYGVTRNDVYQNLKIDNAKQSGFYAQAIVENIKEYNVWLVFSCESKKYRLRLGKVISDGEVNKEREGRVVEIDSTEKWLTL